MQISVLYNHRHREIIMPPPLSITTCYAFVPLEESALKHLREELLAFGTVRNMKGLTLIASEGINATVCGTAAAIDAWKARMRALKSEIHFKDSTAPSPVFRRWSVKIKPEIVAIKNPEIHGEKSHHHLSPAEWQAMLEREDVVVIDARNDYEVALGKFRDAVDPKLRHFSDFPGYIRQSGIAKEKKVLLYCTGGIRCEKALVAMEEEGYQNVFQLHGGILAYLEQFPHSYFDGECFVFDKRVAVDQNLRPSKTFMLCSECGNPVKEPTCAACRTRLTSAAPSSASVGHSAHLSPRCTTH